MKLILPFRLTMSKLLLVQLFYCVGIQAPPLITHTPGYSCKNRTFNSLQSITTVHKKQSFAAQSAYKYTVLLDAGHGGKDHGCQGLEHTEKDFTLAFAKELGAKIKYFSDDIDVRYTRQYDESVSLNSRVAMANEADVDLFISIHGNHGASIEYSGFETYVYGPASSEATQELVHREERHRPAHSQSAHTADHILQQMGKKASQEESFLLGHKISKAVSTLHNIRNRGIKQAEFRVLKNCRVPALLLEIGYLTNPSDVTLLKDVKERNKISETLALSIIDHLR